MNDLQDYLALPKTHRLYSVGLSLFQKYQGAVLYPRQYAKLLPGPLGRNPEELFELLQEIAQNPPAVYVPPVVQASVPLVEVITEEKQTHKDGLVRKVSQELRAAYQVLNKLSDQLYDCDSDAQRADISDQIIAQEKEINQLLVRLDYIKAKGEEPPCKEPEGFELPETEAELSVLQNRKQSHKRKVKLRIDLKHTYAEGHPKRKGLEVDEALYQEILIQLQLIKDKRAWLKNNSK